ncbi:MAG: amidase family protein, partial [Gemmatimonadota bacterium]
DEFAMGSSTENSAFGATRHPLDPERVPGGSSGGSAAAVAAGIAPLALGSETGGSVRQPAAFCGIAGIKPTYGRVSRYGLVAFGSSLDQIGPLGPRVRDAFLLLAAIAGHDRYDATSGAVPVPDFGPAWNAGVRGLTVGVPKEYFTGDLDPRVAERCRDALAALEREGARLRDVSLPHTRFAIPAYYLVAPAEASSNLARYDGVRYGFRAEDAETALQVFERTRGAGFGREVKRRIMLGTYALSAGYYEAYYGSAMRVRARIAEDFTRAFDAGVDVLFTPTTPTVAFRRGERTDDPVQMYLSDVFTVTANLAGVPAVSVPVGAVDGWPVGAQLVARRWDELTLARAADALERALE